jgi:hypothetical protein
MKKTSKKLKELTIDKEEAQRNDWVKLLDHCRMFHLQMVKDLQSPILGSEPDNNELFHRACASAIEDAVLLIQMVSEQGFFDNMPQHAQGPAG